MSWYVQTVKNILSRQVYIGHMVQGRKRQSFYENRGQYKKPREEWIVVENTHEPLIDRETFDKVQDLHSAEMRNTLKTSVDSRIWKPPKTSSRGWSAVPTASVRWCGTRM